MAIDTNGIPTIAASIGDFQTASAIAQITGASTPEASIQSVVVAALAAASTPQHVFIDVKRRKIVVADENENSFSEANFLAGSTVKKQTLAPVAGSVGRSVQWEETARDAGMTATLPNAIKSNVDPARPYKSLSALVSSILSNVVEGAEPFIFIDQGAGVVKVIDPLAARADLQNSVDDKQDDITGATHAAFITLAEPATEGGQTPLKFEGGAF